MFLESDWVETLHATSLQTLRRIFLSLASALTIGLVSACAGLPLRQPTPLPVPTNNAITLTLWHTEAGAAARLLTTFASDFHQAYPNITVRAEQKSNEGDLLRQGLAAIALNQPPGLIIASDRTIAELARPGALMNLDALARDAKLGLTETERQDFFPGSLDIARLPDQQNQLAGLPLDATAIVLYYNADLLKAAKVDAPPRTWDQFGNAARATTKDNVRGWAMAPSAAVFDAFLFSRGSRPLAGRNAPLQAQFTDDAGLQAAQLIATLTRSGAAYLADSADSARNDFARGKTALLFGTTDDLTPLADAIANAGGTFQWGVTNLPQNDPSQPATALFGAAIAIFQPVANGKPTTTDERVQAAWSFARWLTAPEQSARWARVTLSIPVRVSALALLAPDPPPQWQRFRDGFGDTLPTGNAVPNVKDAGQIDAALVEMWTAVANGADPAIALKNTATRVNRLLGQIP